MNLAPQIQKLDYIYYIYIVYLHISVLTLDVNMRHECVKFCDNIE